MNPNIHLKRPREEQEPVEGSPIKKQKTIDVSSCLGRLKALSLVSSEDFPTKIVEITQLFDDLQEALGSQSEAKAQIQSAKTPIKFIQSRIQEISVTDKPEVLEKIEGLLSSLKANVFKISVSVPPCMLSLINPDKVFIESLWTEKQVGVVENENGSELTFSEKLKYKLDDYQLELILKNSPESTIKAIKYFDFTKYPRLSPKAVALIIDHCPNLERKSFQGIASSQFCDHTLLIGNDKIPINKAFLCHFSPYFQGLFASKMREGFAVDDGISETALDMDLEPVRDCIAALIDMYDVSKEQKIERILLLIHYLELLQIEGFEAAAENAAINALDMIKFFPAEELEQAICDINKQVYPYFNNGKFPVLSEKLGELSRSIVGKLLQPITSSFIDLGKLFKRNNDIFANSEKYNEVLEGSIPILKSLHEKQIPCAGTFEFLEDNEAFDFFERNFFFNEKIDTSLLTAFVEGLHLLDPMNVRINLYLGILYKATLDQDNRYQKVQQFLKIAAQKGPEDCIAAHLSEVLLTGAKGHEPNVAEAQKILGQEIEKKPNNSHQSRLVLAYLLTEGSSDRKQIKIAYDQLVPLLDSIYRKISRGHDLSIVEEIVVTYFQFLVVTKGFMYPKNTEITQHFISNALAPYKNCLEVAARRVLFAIYNYGTSSTLRDALKLRSDVFAEHLIDAQKLTTILPMLERTPFYRIALQAIAAFEDAGEWVSVR